MKAYFLNMSIRRKLFLVIFLSSLLVSSSGFFAVLYFSLQSERAEAVRHAQSEMRVLSQDLTKIIVSANKEIAADVVAKLRLFPFVHNVFLFDRQGMLVFQYDKSPSLALPLPDYAQLRARDDAYFEDGLLHMFLPVTYLGEEFGGVFLRQSNEQHDQYLQVTYTIIAWVLPLMLLLSYLLAFWLQRYFSKPITALAGHVRDMAEQHDYGAELSPSAADGSEIGSLYRSIDQLLAAMRTTQQKLHQSESRLEAVINIAGSVLICIDESHRITLFNRQAEHVFGYAAREVLGRPLGMLLPERFREAHTEYIHHFANKNIQKSMAQDRSVVSGLRKDGREFPVEASISQILLGDKKMFTVALSDVSKRQQTERELEAYRLHLEEVVEGRTRELREKNQELEAFSYSVAHDLRAPLRSITSFSQILLEDAVDKLDEDERGHLARVVAAGQHMAELIDGILDLARIGRSQMSVTEVDLSVLATQAKERLSRDAPQRDVRWDIQAGLVARGDAQLLGVVMDNLINNAWKYSGKKPQAKISFGAIRQRNKRVFFVRDNGAGFDMKHAKKLFGVFQRLHPASQFEGTGVGLATVQRIIQRHGGAIWAESVEGEGATFNFTLP
ncbi:MAG TPA: PAS domain S-box protein [Gammaproteobacteria bacterium]|nr:PAS domain S-box protein [Gammaproteobacteria bacterium]